MTPVEKSERERQQFEKWAEAQGDSCSRVKCTCKDQRHSHYDSVFTHWEWLAWQAAFEAGRSAGEGGWIGVEERSPNVGSVVLAWKDMVGARIVEYSQKSEDHRKFTRRDGQWWDNGSQITHWQPLPAGPIADKGDGNG